MDKYGVVFPGQRFVGKYPSAEAIRDLVCFPEPVPLSHPEHWHLLQPIAEHRVTKPVCETAPQTSLTGQIAEYVGG